MRFLIVDDELAQVESLILLLQANGHIAAGAINLASAKELASVHPPDVVILDRYLAHEDGTDFILWLRSNAMTDIPVVVSSAMPQDVVPPFPADARVGYLSKPFAYEDLMGTVFKLVTAGSHEAQDI